MITNELIERINYLARKKRTEGLTNEEKQEQANLREQYLDGIRSQVRASLESSGCRSHHRHHQHSPNCSCHKIK
ncbi:DUF896 domain-containing protein [Bacillota bacterium LX-D]|nr:DUF896 domain-containing protein [Bacillota bacterium LX-D]